MSGVSGASGGDGGGSGPQIGESTGRERRCVVAGRLRRWRRS